MSKVNSNHEHGQVFTCGAACASLDGYGRTQTSVDKLVSAVKSIFSKRSM